MITTASIPAQGAIRQECLACVAGMPCEVAKPILLVSVETFQGRNTSGFRNDLEAHAIHGLFLAKHIQLYTQRVAQATSVHVGL